MLDIDAVAEFAGISARSVRRAIARGDLVALKICNRIRIRPHHLDAWLEASQMPAATPAGGRGKRRASPPAPVTDRSIRELLDDAHRGDAA